jgi:hypothetical protein
MHVWLPLFWVLIGAVCAYYAKARGRRPVGWFLVGLAVGAIGLLLLFLLPALPPRRAMATPAVPPQRRPRFWYYLDAHNRQCGPVSFDALRRAVEGGEVIATTYVWNEELEGWRPLRDVNVGGLP